MELVNGKRDQELREKKDVVFDIRTAQDGHSCPFHCLQLFLFFFKCSLQCFSNNNSIDMIRVYPFGISYFTN